ncbi:MAG TPA: branched-chain amino acid ABC transporter ATP-binding protein/permease [Gaiellaceae bacterium]|nr:branched-chain amino acid ABC transporter ATP-binding protein/permease [Gaiellaceae bacterium]
MAYYVTTLLVYGGVDIIACLALSQQFGIGGVTNFAFIIFQAAGAYAAAALSLPPDSANGAFQTYVGGLQLPFPLPWIGAAIAGGLLALPFALLVGKRLRGDFAAVGLLVTAVMANLLVTNYRPFLNGDAGLALVPAPLSGHLDPESARYQWGYSAVALLLALVTYVFLQRITRSPYGRTLRAMRDNDVVADSLGKNLRSLRTQMLVLGGAIAGLSGGVLVGFINLWDPAAWGYAESIVLFAAVIIGGVGNHRGAVLGAILVPLGFLEATRYLPPVGGPGLVPALEWVAVGLLIVGFLWFRPQGILPERRRRLAAAAPAAPETGGPPAVVRRLPVAATPEVVLEARGLTRSFEGVKAVDDVSLAFARGRLTGLIGPNGAGKSTTLAMLAGTLAPTGGTILFRGEEITRLPAYRRARRGIVRTFQLASEFKRLTVYENLLSAVPRQRGDSFRGAVLGRRYWRADERLAIERAEAMLDRFGLTAHGDTYAGDLSGGQRRLVEIMRALMTEPEVLLLDEPMAGVHPELARRIGELLLGLCADGMTIVMVEHELGIMDEFADPVVVMAEGRVLAEGTMAALRARAEVVEAYLVG